MSRFLVTAPLLLAFVAPARAADDLPKSVRGEAAALGQEIVKYLRDQNITSIKLETVPANKAASAEFTRRLQDLFEAEFKKAGVPLNANATLIIKPTFQISEGKDLTIRAVIENNNSTILYSSKRGVIGDKEVQAAYKVNPPLPAARLILRVPADARVFIEGRDTQTNGESREFPIAVVNEGTGMQIRVSAKVDTDIKVESMFLKWEVFAPGQAHVVDLRDRFKPQIKLPAGGGTFVEMKTTGIKGHFSKDGKWAAVRPASKGAAIEIWVLQKGTLAGTLHHDAASGKQIFEIAGNEKLIIAVGVSEKGDRGISMTKDGTIRVWRMPE